MPEIEGEVRGIEIDICGVEAGVREPEGDTGETKAVFCLVPSNCDDFRIGVVGRTDCGFGARVLCRKSLSVV